MKKHHLNTSSAKRLLKPAIVPALALTLLTSLFPSCEKPRQVAPETEGSIQSLARLSSSPSLYNDILEFNSPDAFSNTLDQLVTDNENYVQGFLENKLNIKSIPDSLPPDSLEKYDQILNSELDVYKVYETFGKAQGINSLIGQFIPVQKAWMKKGGSGDDPLSQFPYPLAVQSVLNIYHEVKIGSSVFKFDVASGSVYEVTDGDYNTVLALRKNISNGNSLPNVVIFSKKANACRTYVSNNISKDYSKGGKKFRLKSYCGVTPMYANAITQNFRIANTGALLWSLCKMTNAICAPELYNNGQCNIPMRGDSSNNGGIKSRFRLEVFTHLGEGWLNIHSPQQKTYAISQIYEPNYGLYPFAW